MRVDIHTGRLDIARWCPSPNRDARPDPADISGIVIHGISLPPGEFGGSHIDRLFTNSLDPAEHPYFACIEGLEVSSHLLIRRTGDLVQYVPFHERAWHAGASCWADRTRCNDFTIGVELEGTDELAYTDDQYRVLEDVVAALRSAYPRITPASIAGHCDIAPGRKTDPGPAFDWVRLAEGLGVRPEHLHRGK